MTSYMPSSTLPTEPYPKKDHHSNHTNLQNSLSLLYSKKEQKSRNLSLVCHNSLTFVRYYSIQRPVSAVVAESRAHTFLDAIFATSRGYVPFAAESPCCRQISGLFRRSLPVLTIAVYRVMPASSFPIKACGLTDIGSAGIFSSHSSVKGQQIPDGAQKRAAF